MQRLPLSSGVYVVRFSSLFRRPISSAFRSTFHQSSTNFLRLSSSIPAASEKQVSNESSTYISNFKLERQIFVASLPLLPIAYFVHGPVMDAVLTAAIVANCHFGAHAILTDYARPIVVGEGVAKLVHYAVYVSTVMLLAGLLHFNYNDVGLTRAFELFFSL